MLSDRTPTPTTAFELPARSEAVADAVFRRLSRWRGARVFHPHGVTTTGALTVTQPGLPGTTLFGSDSTAGVLVRFSKGVGLPGAWPDVLGVAVRVPDAYGPGMDQDLLFATTAPWVGAGTLLAPSRAFDAGSYSTVLPYRTAAGVVLFGAAVQSISGSALRSLEDVAASATTADLRVRVCVGKPLRHWREVATIELSSVVATATGEALRFDPRNTGGGIRPVEFLQRLRASAYTASQNGRPDT